ncbi:MAG TPA: hypothetical protein PLV42_12305 [bacterium]|nr:hypothetical protein [bacterium]
MTEPSFDAFRDNLYSFLDETAGRDGVHYAREVVRRFSLVQCRRALLPPSDGERFVERVLFLRLREFGELFVEFAEAAFKKNFTESDVNGMIETWLREYLTTRHGA